LITANHIGGNCVFDADLMEELCSSSTLWIGVQPPQTPTMDSSGVNEVWIYLIKYFGKPLIVFSF